MALTFDISAGRIRFTDANFVDEGRLYPSDEQFRQCYREAIKRIEILCPDCGESRAVIPWRTTHFVYGLSDRYLDLDRDPRRDPALIIR